MYAVLDKLLGSRVSVEAPLTCLLSVEGLLYMRYSVLLAVAARWAVQKGRSVYQGFVFLL